MMPVLCVFQTLSPHTSPPKNNLIERLEKVLSDGVISTELEPLFKYLEDPHIGLNHRDMLTQNIEWYALAYLHYTKGEDLKTLGINVIGKTDYLKYSTVQDLLSNKQYDQCAAIFTIHSKAPQYGNKKVFTNIQHTATYPDNCRIDSDDASSNSESEFSI